MSGWIGVDLDGTLAHYEYKSGPWDPYHIGAPVPAMQERVKRWLAEGREVRIFTARVSADTAQRSVAAIRFHIEKWCQEHLGIILPVTCTKDYDMIELWDDRAVRVEANTGRPLCPSSRGLE